MTIDSKAVSKALEADVFPLLRDAGFTRSKSRTAWKNTGAAIAVVAFPSLGSYLGSAVGVTSHSFSCVVGLYFTALHSTPWATDPMPSEPKEWECQARRILKKGIFQYWRWRPDIWYVNRSGSNLRLVVADVVRALREEGLPWLAEMAEPSAALDAFERKPETYALGSIAREILGGRVGSFSRAEAASALALACGQRERARAAWARVLANPYYKGPSDLRSLAEERIQLV